MFSVPGCLVFGFACGFYRFCCVVVLFLSARLHFCCSLGPVSSPAASTPNALQELTLSQVISHVFSDAKQIFWCLRVGLGDLRACSIRASPGVGRQLLSEINGNCPVASGLFHRMSHSVSNQNQFYYWKSRLNISIHILPRLVSNGRGGSMKHDKGVFSSSTALLCSGALGTSPVSGS